MKRRFITLMALLVLSGQQLIIAQATTQTRNVSAFTEIALRIGADVHLKQGTTQSVEVKGEQGTLNRLITDVNDRKLVIKFPSDTWFSNWNPGKIDIYVTMPQIDGLLISGSGSIEAGEKIESRILDMTLSGSGDIKLAELKAEKASVALSGSGNVKLSGKENATEFKATISGSGNVKAIDFPASEVNVKISGSGNCWVNSTKNLVVKLAGSGNVVYTGVPLVDSTILGSGNVRKQ